MDVAVTNAELPGPNPYLLRLKGRLKLPRPRHSTRRSDQAAREARQTGAKCEPGCIGGDMKVEVDKAVDE